MSEQFIKPTVITADFRGENAKDPARTNERLLRRGSWRKQRVVVVIPAGELIPAPVYLSHVNLGFPMNNPVCWYLAYGLEVAAAYNAALENILQHPDVSKWEYVLFMEHDNCPQRDSLVRLIGRMDEHPELSAIGGLYFVKGPNGMPHIWGDPKDPTTNYRAQEPSIAGDLVECCAVSMGFTLFRMSLFRDERLRRPWFQTGVTGDGTMTQDLYAWEDFRKHGHRCAVDCSVNIGHYDHNGDFGPPGMMW